MSTDEAITGDDRAALSAWKVGSIVSAEIPRFGAVNRTLLVETAGRGGFALRGYAAYRDRERVEAEHRLITRAGERGLPVVAPIPLPGGEGTVLERDGCCLYALFPRIYDDQLVRGAFDMPAVTAMGSFLGQVHRVLESLPPEVSRPKTFRADTAQTLQNLEHIEAAVHALPRRDERDENALRRISEQRTYLRRQSEDAVSLAGSLLARLPRQIIHGDYQEMNLFFGGQGEARRVTAIIDWEQAGVAPRTGEVIRALYLMLKFHPARCGAFLATYRERMPLSDAELETGATLYALFEDRNTWAMTAAYLEGNARARRYIEPDGFTPFAQKWERLRQELLLL